jgi:predicted secreted protein
VSKITKCIHTYVATDVYYRNYGIIDLRQLHINSSTEYRNSMSVLTLNYGNAIGIIVQTYNKKIPRVVRTNTDTDLCKANVTSRFYQPNYSEIKQKVTTYLDRAEPISYISILMKTLRAPQVKLDPHSNMENTQYWKRCHQDPTSPASRPPGTGD